MGEGTIGLVIGPSDLLKIATHSKVKLLPVHEPESPLDEAASDPPSRTSDVGKQSVAEEEDSKEDEIEGLADMLAEENEENQAAKRRMESMED